MADDETRLRATTDGTPALPVLTDEEWARRQPRRGRFAGRSGRRRGRRPLLIRVGHRAVLVAASATIGVSAAFLVVHANGASDRPSLSPSAQQADTDPARSPVSATPDSAVPEEVTVRLAAQTVLPGASFAPRAIASVHARPRADSGELRLLLRTRRAVAVRVTVEMAGSALRRRTVRAERAGTLHLRFAGLPSGVVRWRVAAPGERAEQGRATVAAPRPETVRPSGHPSSSPAPTPVPPPVSPTGPTPVKPSPGSGKPPRPAPPKGTGGTGGGPPGPRDPDTDGPGSGPIDPDDF